MSEELALSIKRPGGGSWKVSGWEGVSVTLRCEAFPNSFEVALSNPAKQGDAGVVAAAGDEVQVLLGTDTVVTGYIDRDANGGATRSHVLSVIGRGKTQDLVDCSAEWEGGRIEGDAVAIATKLASAYGIKVKLANGASAGPQIPGWALNYGETAASIIQRVAQNAGLLCYEDSDGTLLLSGIGSQTAKGGIVYGQNVEAWSVTNSANQRYSHVRCASFAVAVLDVGGPDFFDTEKDPNVRRHRQLDIVQEEVAGQNAQEFTIRKAKWEIARRAGRATAVTVTVDSWRDSGGKLWLPNTIVPVDVPGLRIDDKNLCVSEVTFRRDGTGTHADLVLLPREAFLLEPIALMAAPLDVKGPDGK